MNNEQQTMNRSSYIVCGVERGWKGMRQFALALADKGYEVDLLLREKIPIELLKVISPRKGIRIIPGGKKTFPFRFIAKVIEKALFHKVAWLVFNRHERVEKNRWLRRLVRAEYLVLEEKGNDYCLFSKRGVVTIEELEDFNRTW